MGVEILDPQEKISRRMVVNSELFGRFYCVMLDALGCF